MDSGSDGAQPLQFETAVSSDPSSETTVARGVTCAACASTIADQYFDVNGQPVCEVCRDQIARHAETPRSWAVLARAGLFGVGAAVAGAVLYYAVIAITNFEIGLVAIAIGYMVGYAVHRGAGSRGGRRFQVVALVLTYWSVGLAYTPLAFQGMSEESQEASSTAEAAAPESEDASDATGDLNFTLAFFMLLAFTVVLPVLAVVGSLPSGLISAAIIAFGMHQAWRMTAAPNVQITGPYRIAGESAAAT